MSNTAKYNHLSVEEIENLIREKNRYHQKLNDQIIKGIIRESNVVYSKIGMEEQRQEKLYETFDNRTLEIIHRFLLDIIKYTKTITKIYLETKQAIIELEKKIANEHTQIKKAKNTQTILDSAIRFLQEFIREKENTVEKLKGKARKKTLSKKLKPYIKEIDKLRKDNVEILEQSAGKDKAIERLKAQISEFSKELEQEFLKLQSLKNDTKE